MFNQILIVIQFMNVSLQKKIEASDDLIRENLQTVAPNIKIQNNRYHVKVQKAGSEVSSNIWSGSISCHFQLKKTFQSIDCGQDLN